MVTINNIDSLKLLAQKDKIFMVKSKRDGRLGTIVGRNSTHCVIKMENIEECIKIDYNVLSQGFTFIFSKKQAVLEWWAIKCTRGSIPNLSTIRKLYVCTMAIYDSLESFYPTLTNEEIFAILKNYRNSLIDEQRKH